MAFEARRRKGNLLRPKGGAAHDKNPHPTDCDGDHNIKHYPNNEQHPANIRVQARSLVHTQSIAAAGAISNNPM